MVARCAPTSEAQHGEWSAPGGSGASLKMLSFQLAENTCLKHGQVLAQMPSKQHSSRGFPYVNVRLGNRL